MSFAAETIYRSSPFGQVWTAYVIFSSEIVFLANDKLCLREAKLVAFERIEREDIEINLVV